MLHTQTNLLSESLLSLPDFGACFSQGYIMNQHYEVVKKVRTANEQVLGDLHEFKLTDSGSALIAYQTKAELSYRGKSFWVRDVRSLCILSSSSHASRSI